MRSYPFSMSHVLYCVSSFGDHFFGVHSGSPEYLWLLTVSNSSSLMARARALNSSLVRSLSSSASYRASQL